MNTPAVSGLAHAAPTPTPGTTPTPDTTPASRPASPPPPDQQSKINDHKSPSPPLLQIQDHIHPTDLLPPGARPFNPNGKKSRRATSLEKSLADLAPGAAFRTLRLADVRSRSVDWLWPNRIPIGKVTLLIGDPGVGKSLLALDLAARLSRRAAMPDAQSPFASSATTNPTEPATTANSAPDKNKQHAHCKLPGVENDRFDSLPPAPCSALLFSAEDHLADTIRPRLEALGADLARIITVTTADANNSPLALPHVDLLIPLLERALDTAPDCRLIIVDPISAYLGRAIENLNSEVRRIMGAFNDLAARRRLAILAINHLRKQEGSALQRSMGSLAFVAAARATWLVVKDPAQQERRLLLPLKNNFATDTTGLAFSILPLPLGEGTGEGALGEGRGEGPTDHERPTSLKRRAVASYPPTIAWSDEPIDVAADEALLPLRRRVGRPTAEREDARRWIRAQLDAGARPFAEIEAHASVGGYNLTTLRRAFRELGGEAVRVGFGPLGEWFWRIPGIGDQNPQPTFGDLWKELEKNTARTDSGI